jgi:thiol-disulfide isomerase/thioredoxin
MIVFEREMVELAQKRYLGIVQLFAAAFAAVVLLSSPSAGHELQKQASIDLSSALDFAAYTATGSGRQIGELLGKIDELSPSEGFISAVREVKSPTVLVVYGNMSCPDCAATVPFVEAIHKVNPLITTLYFTRTDEAERVVKDIAGVYKTPTIFSADAEGSLGREYLLEFPDSVRKLVDEAADADSRREIIREFRDGKYAADLEADLLKLLGAASR